jgi:hypothetical protein
MNNTVRTYSRPATDEDINKLNEEYLAEFIKMKNRKKPLKARMAHHFKNFRRWMLLWACSWGNLFDSLVEIVTLNYFKSDRVLMALNWVRLFVIRGDRTRAYLGTFYCWLSKHYAALNMDVVAEHQKLEEEFYKEYYAKVDGITNRYFGE